jgi:alpha-amylase
MMNWDSIAKQKRTKEVLAHWQKLGTFRANHPAVGAGVHQMISVSPYYFYRSYQKDDYKDLVVIGLHINKGEKVINVSKVFEDGDTLHDAYSGEIAQVKNGMITIKSQFEVVLLEKK